MAKPKKRLILFVVEGKSDKEALERPIAKLLEGNKHDLKSEFLYLETDVTSDHRNKPGNILENINKHYFLRYFSANEHYYPREVYEVVQICDLDGAFIPDDHCKQFTELIYTEKGFYYDPQYIYGSTEAAVIDRNQRKSENIRFLLTQSKIKVKSKSAPYFLFYFSTNIDHFLCGKMNAPTRDKIANAESFADKCCTNLGLFMDCFRSSISSTQGFSYEESWEYAMEDTHSLEANTNFNLYLEHLLSLVNSETLD